MNTYHNCNHPQKCESVFQCSKKTEEEWEIADVVGGIIGLGVLIGVVIFIVIIRI